MRLAWGLAATCLAGVAEAHQFKVERSLMLEAWPDKLHVAAAIRVPSGEGQAVLRLLAPDAKAREALLATRALDGLRLAVGTATVTLSEVKMRLNEVPEGPLELMLLGWVALPPQAVTVNLTTTASSEPLEVRVLDGRRRFETRSRRARLGRQDRLRVRYEAAP